MTPTELILIISGAGLGATVGFALAAIVFAGRVRHSARDAWRDANRYYSVRFHAAISGK